jgi:hypothetical protein
VFIFVIFAIVGIGLAVNGARMLVRTRNFLGGAVRTEGEIVSWRQEWQSAGKSTTTTKYPTLRFTAHDGRTIETEADVGVNSWPAGDDGIVTVLYDPADPEHARLATLDGRGYAEALLFLIGGLVLAFGPFLFGR